VIELPLLKRKKRLCFSGQRVMDLGANHLSVHCSAVVSRAGGKKSTHHQMRKTQKNKIQQGLKA